VIIAYIQCILGVRVRQAIVAACVSESDPRKNQKGGLGDRLAWKYAKWNVWNL